MRELDTQAEPLKIATSRNPGGSTWEPTPYCCPECGRATVVTIPCGSDEECGDRYLCLLCTNTFFLPYMRKWDDDEDKKLLSKLRPHFVFGWKE